jgi:hypothetical protein
MNQLADAMWKYVNLPTLMFRQTSVEMGIQ